ncbi:glycosyltransferase [soil metagenome]
MIRVLHLIDHLGSGGAQTALLNLLRYRDPARFECVVASMHGRGPMAAEFEALGLPVVSLSARRWPPLYLFALPRLLRTQRFDVVHFHLFGANWIAKPIAWLFGCRVLFNHDQCNDALRDKGLFLLLDRLTNRLSSKILAVSRSIVRFLGEKENIPAQLIEYFPNGVDVRSFPPATPASRKAARERWSLPADAFIVGGIGRLVAQKDFSFFLEIAVLLHAQEPQVHFVIFGDGPEEMNLKKRCRILGLESRFTFAGYVSERSAIYQAIDLLLLTSRYEGTPMVLLEAMVSLVPIVATAVDGTAEILTSSRSALLFQLGEEVAGMEAVLALLRDPALRSRLAIQAQFDALEHFDAEKQMKLLESLYDSALSA